MAIKRGAVSKRGAYRKYTIKDQKAALKDAAQLGVPAAARKHGIPSSTLNGWCRTTSAQTEAAPKEDAKTDATAPVAVTAAPKPAPHGRRVAKSYTPSQKAVILEHAAANGVTAAHKKYDVSRFTIYDWKRKVRLATEGKVESPTSGPVPQEIEAQRDKEILDQWHRHPGLGPSQIKNQLRREGVKVSVHTTRRVMQEAGYRPPKVKRQGHDERFEAVRPNHCREVSDEVGPKKPKKLPKT